MGTHTSRRGFFLGVAALCCLAGCSVEVVHDLREAQANAVLAALGRQGIPAEKVRSRRGQQGGFAITVGRTDATAAWRALRQLNLPAPPTPGVKDLLGSAGLAPTRARQRALLRHALAGELARTLQSVEGVAEARVHLVLPAPPGLPLDDRPRPAPRASVLLQVTGKSPLTEDQVRRLVAGGVQGLERQAVSVVVKRRAHRPPPAGSPALPSLGPFRVAASSRGPLLATLSALLVLLATAGVAVLLLLWRARRRPAPSPPAPDPQLAQEIQTGLTLLDQSFGGRTSKMAEDRREPED